MAANSPINFLVVHCSASKPSQKVDVQVIERWHRKRGFLKIGYHYVIYRDGSVHKGREESEVGAHVQNHNKGSIGICLVGGIAEDGKSEANFTLDQYASLADLLGELLKRYPKAEIRGHRDFPGVAKDCPCFDVKQWWHDTVVEPKL